MTYSRFALFFLCFALVACASQATPEDAQMANTLCEQGKGLLAAGKKADARDVYANAVYRDDQNPRAWNGLGVAYDLLGKSADAKDAYQHAASLAPNDPSIANNLAHVYVELNEPDEAVKILQPYAGDASAPATLRQTLAAATRAAQVKQQAEGDIYADIGSYPTEGMAQGHLREAKALLSDKDLNFSIVPEVKTGGGIPTFTVKITGRSPQDICDDLNEQAIPCVPHGK